MREIKFRGYAVRGMINNQWLYGFGVKDIDYVDGAEEWHLHTVNGVYEVFPRSIGQYTGLKDENDKEIYEGDLMCPSFKLDNVIEVYWDSQASGFYYRYINSETQRYQLTKGMVKNFKVNGNIYENPELLEVD